MEGLRCARNLFWEEGIGGISFVFFSILLPLVIKSNVNSKNEILRFIIQSVHISSKVDNCAEQCLLSVTYVLSSLFYGPLVICVRS